MAWNILASINSDQVTKNASYKHNVRTGATITVNIGNTIGRAGTWNWYITPDGSLQSESGYFYNGKTFSQTVSIAPSYNFYTNAPTYYLDNNTISGVFSYGAKATPNVYSSFSGGYVNPNNDLDIRFSVGYIDNIDVQYSVTSGVLYIKNTNSSTYTNYSFTGNKVTVPSSFFTTGNEYEAYADITLDDNTVKRVNINNISTIDSIPTVNGISPNNVIVYGDTSFEWQYINANGNNQTAFDLQISEDSETWQTIANHVLSSSTTYNYNISTVGDLYWRVRAYNLDNNYSEWSTPLFFINNLPPNPPEITNITGNGRITVNWNSTNQTAFELEILDENNNLSFSSGIVAGANNSYFVNEYLSAGAYTIRLRVQNVYGKFSEWSTKEYSVSALSIDPPSFNIIDGDVGVFILIDSNTDYQYYYLKRNGVLIAKIDGLQYIDIYANGYMEYELIGITGNDYAISAFKNYEYITNYSKLIDPINNKIYDIRYRIGSPLGVSANYEIDYSDNRYLGAPTSIINVSSFKARRYTINFHYRGKNIEEILGKTLLFIDTYGNRDWVVCTGIAKGEHRLGNEVSLNLNSTIYDEAINYDL